MGKESQHFSYVSCNSRHTNVDREIPGIPGPSYLPGETQAPAKEKQLGRNSIGVPSEALLACHNWISCSSLSSFTSLYVSSIRELPLRYHHQKQIFMTINISLIPKLWSTPQPSTPAASPSWPSFPWSPRPRTGGPRRPNTPRLRSPQKIQKAIDPVKKHEKHINSQRNARNCSICSNE